MPCGQPLPRCSGSWGSCSGNTLRPEPSGRQAPVPPKQTSYARPWRLTTLLLCMVLSLNSMTGCATRYVVVPGGERVTISKQELDQLYSDNEALLKALEGCK